MNRDFNSENQKLLTERNELRAQLDKLMEELKLKTKKYDAELKHLAESLGAHETSVEKLKTENKELNSLNLTIQTDYNLVKETSKEQHLKIDKLQKEIDQLRLALDSTSKDSQHELKIKLDIMSKELNAKWSDTLRFILFIICIYMTQLFNLNVFIDWLELNVKR